MSSAEKSREFSIRKIQASDMENIIKVIGSTFMTAPTNLYTDIRQEEIERYTELLTEVILSDDLTLIAETEDGVPIGAAVSFDFSTIPSKPFFDFVNNHRHFSKISEMLEYLETYYSKLQGFEHGALPRGHSATIALLGSEPKYRESGVGTKLCIAALDLYKSRNFRFAVMDATSQYSRRIGCKLGFETKHHIPFEAIYKDGSMSRVIAEGHDATYLMVKELE